MFSVLTPTYNRVKELPRVFYSLQKQTFRNFEWIISDDGSSDGTTALVQEWQSKPLDFNIIYHQMPKNRGKSHAVNAGLDHCSSPYTLIADSDDTFAAHTLKDLKLLWESIERTTNPKKIGAIWTLVEDDQGILIGEPWPKNFWQVSFKERVLERQQPIAGEKWHCWRTEVLRENNMYVHPKSFISEAATWDKINTEFDFLCVNQVHRRYWFSEDGLIHKKKAYKDLQKVNYYTAYFHLKKSSIWQLFSTAHYRGVAFNYIRASLYYKDRDTKLKGWQGPTAWMIFLWYFPKRAFFKIFSN